MEGKTNIYVFKKLKELSKGKTGKQFECGLGFTNKNCMADFVPESKSMSKRYTLSIFILDTFKKWAK